MQQAEQLLDFIEKAKLGDEEAFAHVFEKTHLMVYNIACAAIKNTEEAKDIVSEVYIRVFRYLPTLRDSHSFIRWLTVITHNVCNDHQNEIISCKHGAALPEPPGEDDIELWHQKEALQSVIQKVIHLLPESQQRAVNYVYFHQLSVGQAAALENCSVNTIKSRLFYARTTLRRAIENEERRTGDKLHLPPVVLGLAALMSLPHIPFSLSAAESTQIFSAVLGALSLGQTVSTGSIALLTVPEGGEPTPKRGKLASVLRRKYLLKFTPAAIIPLIVTVLLLMTAMLGIGYLQRRESPPPTDSNPLVGEQATETTASSPTEISPFTYSIVEDGIELKKITTDQHRFEIPAEIDGLPVVALADSVFGEGLFIEHLILPASLQTVSGPALAALKELKVIEINGDSPYLKAINGVLYSADMTLLMAYPNNKPTTDFLIPSSVTVIGEHALTSRNLLTLSNFQNSCVETLRPYALAGCINLQTLCLPISLTNIEENALACPSLTSILTLIGNENFWTINDALYNHDRTVLIRYPAGRVDNTFAVYSSAHTVAAYAFYGSPYLQHLVLHNNITTLEPNALAGMPELLSIRLSENIAELPAGVLANNPKITEYTLPTGLKRFDASAFAGCPGLERLIFCSPYPTIVGGETLDLAGDDTMLAYPLAEESWQNADKFGVRKAGAYTPLIPEDTP